MRRVLFPLLTALGAGSLSAQATLSGRAIDDSTGAPVADAEIVRTGSQAVVRSDAEGRFTLGGIPTGIGFVMVRKIGFRPVRLRTVVFGPDTITVEVRLRQTVTELEPIEVTASAVPPGMQAFAERRLFGEGAFIDWNVLRASEHRRLSDLLIGVRGVRIARNRSGRPVATAGRGGVGRDCPMAIWLDGLPLYRSGVGAPPSIDDFIVSDLEAVEIFRGPAETPPELGGPGAQCGTLVLWTRRG